MTFVRFISAFRLYSADVLLLALGVTLLTSLLKTTVFKSFDKKVFVFLPFALGLILYAVYRMLVTLSVAPLASDLCRTLEGGFGCGCAATLYYVFYEQFLRGKFSDPLCPLLECVPEEERTRAAKELYAGCRDLEADERIEYLKENLNTYADPPLSEAELEATALLIAEYLSSIGK